MRQTDISPLRQSIWRPIMFELKQEQEPFWKKRPMIKATIRTSKGDIKLNLFDDQTPLTAASFLNLAKRGYYDGLTFHRVIDNFMIQGGCPLGSGTGGPGYNFENEVVEGLRHDRPGILSMANAGPGTNGSQFFITHVPTNWLDGKHTVFGAVVDDDDQKVVNSIAAGDRIESIEVHDNLTALFESMSDQLKEWNEILDRR